MSGEARSRSPAGPQCSHLENGAGMLQTFRRSCWCYNWASRLLCPGHAAGAVGRGKEAKLHPPIVGTGHPARLGHRMGAKVTACHRDTGGLWSQSRITECQPLRGPYLPCPWGYTVSPEAAAGTTRREACRLAARILDSGATLGFRNSPLLPGCMASVSPAGKWAHCHPDLSSQ